MFFVIWDATHTEWPFPITGSSTLLTARFLQWKDYARGSKQRTMAVSGEEFLRRCMLHVLPRGFVRIRFFGFLANRHRASLLPLCQQLLETSPRQNLPTPTAGETRLPASWLCPHCGGAMVLIEKLTAQQICWRATEGSPFIDTS